MRNRADRKIGICSWAVTKKAAINCQPAAGTLQSNESNLLLLSF